MRSSLACAALVAAAIGSPWASAAGQTLEPNAAAGNRPPASSPESGELAAAAGEERGGLRDAEVISIAARQGEAPPAPQAGAPKREASPMEGYEKRLEATQRELQELRRRLKSEEGHNGVRFRGRDPDSYEPFAPRISPPSDGGDGGEFTPPPNIRSLLQENETPSDQAFKSRLEETQRELADLRRRLQSGAVSGGILFRGRDPNSYTPFAPHISRPGEAQSEVFPHAAISGFFQADTGFFSQDAASVATFGRILNGSDFRRARLILLGSATENVNYLMEVDFALIGRPSFRDVWAEVEDLPVFGTVRVGNFKSPFSLDELTSARQLTFLERSTVTNTFAPFRRIGLASLQHDVEGYATWAAEVSRALSDAYASDIGNSGGFAGTGRVTLLPYYDEPSGGRYYLHLGASYEIAFPGNDTFRFHSNPDFFLGSQQQGMDTGTSGQSLPGPLNGVPYFVDTGNLKTQNFSVYGAELAGSWGSFNYQAEWMASNVNQIGNPWVFFQGAYFEASYFLTGEHRPYSRPSGTLGAIKPFENFFFLDRGRGAGWGGWEIAGRLSWVDLDDKNVQGGRIIDYTAGLNWYLNANVKLQFNYINAWVNNAVHGRSDTNIFALRLQAQF